MMMMKMMLFVSKLLWTVVWIIIYVSLTSLLNQTGICRAIFSSFGQAVCIQRTLAQEPEASTKTVHMSTVRYESKPIPSEQRDYLTSVLVPYRLCFKRSHLQHSGCLCCL